MRAPKRLLVVLFLCARSLVLAEDPVNFADANLKDTVEAQLGIADPTPTDMLGLTTLAARSKNIRDLSGLESGANLRELFLYGNQISNISALSGLTQLNWLDLDNNQVSDISALSGLTDLTWLDLDDNQISDIASLSGLTKLTWLDLDNNQIDKISPLSELTRLTSLDLAYNQISNISVLSRLGNLERLGLEDNQISNISALSRLTSLSVLWLHDNPLNQEACDVHIPQIISTNPGIDIRYDPCPSLQHSLDISSTAGGSVALPGEGSFSYDKRTAVALTALPDNACHFFVNWTGTAVDAGAADDPNDPNTILTINGSHTLKANFRTKTVYVDDDAWLDPGPKDLATSDPYEDGTEDHPFDSIQEAIESAHAGCRSIVLVRPGAYFEHINFMGKNISVTGIDPAAIDPTAFPLIAAPDTCTTVTFNQAEAATCQLSGFVLTHAYGEAGCAIECLGSSPTIKNCLITGNRATNPYGAIIYCQDSNSVFENCTIADNDAGPYSAALNFVNCNAVIANSIVWGNRPAQIRVVSGHDPMILYTDVQGSWPGVGNIDQNPDFALSGYWADWADTHVLRVANHPSAFWIEGDYHLMSEHGRWDMHGEIWTTDEYTSPCVDAGDRNWLDLHGPDHHRKTINMGAYGGTNQVRLSLPAPIACWRFDEGAGDTASDSAGDKHGTVYGATWTEGILDRALQFDGIDDYVDCANAPALTPDLFTISMWIYAQASAGSRSILCKAGGDKDKDYDFKLFAAHNPNFSFGDGSQNVVLHSSSVIPLNEWIHIALTRDKTEAAIHVNGTQLMSKTYDFAPSATHHKLIIGGGSLQPFQGKIDDLHIYDVVLSPEEIEHLGRQTDR